MKKSMQTLARTGRALVAAGLLPGALPAAATAGELAVSEPAGAEVAAHGTVDWWFEENLPYYLYDRGAGMPTSLFGTYVRKGELLFYPFYEYVLETDFEYNPDDFGVDLDEDFFGRGQTHQYLVFAAYGFTDRLMAEAEFSFYEENTVERSGRDRGPGPRTFREAGPGTFEMQVRYRAIKESETFPEVVAFVQSDFPFQKGKELTGTQEWELAYGLAMIKGFRWGTLSARAALQHEPESDYADLGEWAVEYLKRFGSDGRHRVVATMEAQKDTEFSAIFEYQWFFHKNAMLKLNSGFGLNREAADFAPEIGVTFRF